MAMDLHRLLYGVIGGINGAACMSVLRLLARRAGIIDEPVPHVVEAWAADRLGWSSVSGRLGHHATQEILHLGVGAAGGVLYSVLGEAGRKAAVPSGAALGVAVWGLAFSVAAPLLGITRPAWRRPAAENGVNLAAHLAYGLVTALMARELSSEPPRPRPVPVRYAVRVG